MSLSNLFRRTPQLAVGLDIGSSAIKLVELRDQKGELHLQRLGIEPLSSEAIVEGSIMDSSLVVDAIHKLNGQTKVKGTNYATSLSGHSVIIRKIQLPTMSSEELAECIQWEAEQYIPFDINDVRLDYVVLSEGEPGRDNMEVLVIAVKRDKVNDYVSVISQTGKTAAVVDIDAFAVQNCYEANYDIDPQKVVALVNMGAGVTNINILARGTTVFWRDISFGGNQFTEALQREFNLSFDQAEALKRGETVDRYTLGDARGVLDTVSGEMASELRKTFDFFSEFSAEGLVDEVVLSGGCALTPNLQQILIARFGVPTELMNPFRCIHFEESDFDDGWLKCIAPMMAVAVGLAMRRIDGKPAVRRPPIPARQWVLGHVASPNTESSPPKVFLPENVGKAKQDGEVSGGPEHFSLTPSVESGMSRSSKGSIVASAGERRSQQAADLYSLSSREGSTVREGPKVEERSTPWWQRPALEVHGAVEAAKAHANDLAKLEMVVERDEELDFVSLVPAYSSIDLSKDSDRTTLFVYLSGIEIINHDSSDTEIRRLWLSILDFETQSEIAPLEIKEELLVGDRRIDARSRRRYSLKFTSVFEGAIPQDGSKQVILRVKAIGLGELQIALGKEFWYPAVDPSAATARTGAEPSTPAVPRPLRVFLCHSTADKPTVRDLYKRLHGDGFAPWLDEEDILGGQAWDVEIRKAVRAADVVIVCLSRGSITKTGYVQKEIRFALAVSEEQPEGVVYIIPVRLEECSVPESLSKWQWVDLFEELGYKRLLLALRARAGALGT